MRERETLAPFMMAAKRRGQMKGDQRMEMRKERWNSKGKEKLSERKKETDTKRHGKRGEEIKT